MSFSNSSNNIHFVKDKTQSITVQLVVNGRCRRFHVEDELTNFFRTGVPVAETQPAVILLLHFILLSYFTVLGNLQIAFRTVVIQLFAVGDMKITACSILQCSEPVQYFVYFLLDSYRNSVEKKITYVLYFLMNSDGVRLCVIYLVSITGCYHLTILVLCCPLLGMLREQNVTAGHLLHNFLSSIFVIILQEWCFVKFAVSDLKNKQS